MFLHNESEHFHQLVNEAAGWLGFTAAIVGKDYYITCFLKELMRLQPRIIFKGGTCLSKCHKVISRFSEDVDLSYENEGRKLTEGMHRHLKVDVLAAAQAMGLDLSNLSEIRSRRDFNCYEFDYPKIQSVQELKDKIVVETAVFQASFPTEKKLAATMIYDYLFEQGRMDIVEQYGLQPFEVTVQTIERTFIDKVFAICDYYESGTVLRNSRHIYDLFKLYPLVSFDLAFTGLVDRVRVVRQASNRCVSAQPGYCVSDTLGAIERTNFYKDDYHRVTTMLLTEEVSYREAVSVLSAIARTGAF